MSAEKNRAAGTSGEQEIDSESIEILPKLEDGIDSQPPEIPPPSPADKLELARINPLRRYLLEIKNYPKLDADEERRLALLYRDEGDQEAAHRLITANLGLVVKVAMMYNRVYSNAMDLVQEGNIGLLEAVKRFDPFKGARLPTYATWWIKAYIIKFIIDNFRIVRVGTTNERRRLLFNLRKEKAKLRLQGIEPTTKLIAQRLDVSEKDVEEIQQNIEGGDISFDSPVQGSDSLTFGDTLASADALLDERLARGELRELFNAKIQELSSQLNEREVVILRSRLLSEEPFTLQTIASQFGVTREAIRLSEKSLVAKIKAHMQDSLRGITDVEIAMLD